MNFNLVAKQQDECKISYSPHQVSMLLRPRLYPAYVVAENNRSPDLCVVWGSGSRKSDPKSML